VPERSLELSLHCSIVSTVNLFTSNQNIQFASYSIQNSDCYLTCPYYPILNPAIPLCSSLHLGPLLVASISQQLAVRHLT